MAWTATTRANSERSFGRYASDLTDGEWRCFHVWMAPFMQGFFD